jgi:hypothetical protein
MNYIPHLNNTWVYQQHQKRNNNELHLKNRIDHRVNPATRPTIARRPPALPPIRMAEPVFVAPAPVTVPVPDGEPELAVPEDVDLEAVARALA